MTEEDFENTLKLSYYKEIATLNEAHNVTLVQHTESSRTYIRKVLTTYNKDVYSEIMNHPVIGVPKIFDLIESNGKLIVIEEYVSGRTLQDIFDEHGCFSIEEVRDYALKLCDILEALHSLVPPVIHRDIKPSNLILADDGRIVLIDLNGAKLTKDHKPKDTILMGTHGFAAPEQYGFGKSTEQTDFFGTGRLMLYLLTGSTDSIERCPQGLRDIITECTQVEPSRRYSSASALKSSLLKSRHRTPFISYRFIFCTVIISLLLICIVIYFISQNSSIIPEPEMLHPTEVLQPTEVSQPATVLQPTDTPTVTDTPSLTNIPLTQVPDEATPAPDYTTPIGVYEGNDKEKLVIAENGLAYYYCYDIEYTEVECPWLLKDDTITISFSLMHCDVTASTKEGFKELLFKSGSLNWNTEQFEKISNDAAAFILDPPPSPAQNVIITSSGDRKFVLDGIRFTVPKQFHIGDILGMAEFPTGINSRYQESTSDYYDNYFAFSDLNILGDSFDESFLAIAFFYPMPLSKETLIQNPKETAMDILGSFMTNIQINYMDTISIAGRDSYSVGINGLLNNNFGGITEYIMTGNIVLIPALDENTVLVIQLIQRAGTKADDSSIFKSIIETAEVPEE